jgi:hypothetical protein
VSTEVDKGLTRLGVKPKADSRATPALKLATIVATDGQGVASRNGCSDDARLTDDGIPEGAQVRIIESGAATCAGWVYVEWQGRRTWVRDRYLSSSSP